MSHGTGNFRAIYTDIHRCVRLLHDMPGCQKPRKFRPMSLDLLAAFSAWSRQQLSRDGGTDMHPVVGLGAVMQGLGREAV